jgi:hypothetical protein
MSAPGPRRVGVGLLVVHAYAADPDHDPSTTAASRAVAQGLVDDTLTHVRLPPPPARRSALAVPVPRPIPLPS